MRNITDMIYEMLSKFYCNYAQNCDLYLLLIDDVQNAFPDGNNALRLYSVLQMQMADVSAWKLMILVGINMSLGNIYPDYNTTCLLVGWGILPI